MWRIGHNLEPWQEMYKLDLISEGSFDIEVTAFKFKIKLCLHWNKLYFRIYIKSWSNKYSLDVHKKPLCKTYKVTKHVWKAVHKFEEKQKV